MYVHYISYHHVSCYSPEKAAFWADMLLIIHPSTSHALIQVSRKWRDSLSPKRRSNPPDILPGTQRLPPKHQRYMYPQMPWVQKIAGAKSETFPKNYRGLMERISPATKVLVTKCHKTSNASQWHDSGWRGHPSHEIPIPLSAIISVGLL